MTKRLIIVYGEAEKDRPGRRFGQLATFIYFFFYFLKNIFSRKFLIQTRAQDENRNTTPLIYSSGEWLVIKVTTFFKSISFSARSQFTWFNDFLSFFFVAWPRDEMGRYSSAIHQRNGPLNASEKSP